MKMPATPAVRASISFPPALYETLEEIAKQKKVSLAWVVRDASEKYAIRAAVEPPGARARIRTRRNDTPEARTFLDRPGETVHATTVFGIDENRAVWRVGA